MLLVVEDEALIRIMLEEGLTDSGFEIMAVSDGNQAIAELNTGTDRFRVIITDIRLGKGPDGWEVGRHARELARDMPVIYITADSANAWPAKGVPGSVLVSKSFLLEHITSAVSMLLTEADAHPAINGDNR